MKGIISGLSLFILIIALSVITNFHTDKVAEDINNCFIGCEDNILLGNWGLAEEKIKTAREVFVKKSHAHESYLIHEDIERLSDILTNIEIAVSLKDKNESFSNIKIFRRRLRELSESDKLSFNNIL